MSPTHMSGRKRPVGAYAPLPLSGNWISQSRVRSRLTNLAVSSLSSTSGSSSSYNSKHALFSPTPKYSAKAWNVDLPPESAGRPPSVEATINRDPRMRAIDHLVMVPGHAVWLGTDPERVHRDEDWVLEPMQRGGSVNTYVKHIERAAAVARDDPHALLVFSGGATRSHLTSPLSEASSYHRLAAARGLLRSPAEGTSSPVAQRATTEEYASDSYENLLFSIARFREVTGRWPDKITVVGYGMKRKRFEQSHRGAIRFPAQRFRYIGIDDEGNTSEHYLGESKHGYAPFSFSPAGCRPPLSTKRLDRNPFSRYPSYHSSVPELVPSLEWCPQSTPVGEVGVPTSIGQPGSDRSAGEGEGEGHFGDTAGMQPPKGFRVFEGKVPWAR